VTISPPRDSESQAGEHPVTFRLVSQQNPDDVLTQEGVLVIAGYAHFESELQPEMPIEAGQNAQLKISNEGNTSETYQIDWQSEDDVLVFDLWQQEGEETVFKEVESHEMEVEPGKQETAHFRAGLRKRPFIGGTRLYPFQVKVLSSDEDGITHEGGVNDRGLIPIWVLPLVLILCIAFACVGVYIYNWWQDQAPPADTDDSWARVQEAGVLKVATSADYPPFSYYNSDYLIDGFDIALIRDVGIVLGVETEVSDYAFEGLGSALQIGQEDVAIAAISITPEREGEFNFSNIYYVSEDGILARSDSGIGPITSPSQLAGLRVGVQRFTVYDSWAEDVLVAGGIISQDQLFVYSKPEHAVDDLLQQRIDVVVMDLQPATAALAKGGLELVGQGLNQQRMAIALPKGANALRNKINEALLYMQNQGRINQLVQYYLGLNPEDIIPPPTPEPTPVASETPLPTATEDPNTPTPTPCIDAMEFIKDLNYDDQDLTNFPDVDPGEAFQKGWQFRNSGSCTWTGSYFIKYSHGTQMGGQPTSISGEVKPGDTYDMYVNLVAPDMPGEYVGYWQMHNAESRPFGQTVWVAVEVRDLNTTTPTATVTQAATLTPTDVPPEPTATDVPPEPTATDVPPEPTATDVPPEPTATEEPGEDLRGTTWLMAGYLADIQDADLTDPIPDVDVQLIFNEGGMMEGNSGCNTFTGDYITDGTQLTLENIVTTRLICDQPAGIMEQENAFITLLEEVEEYRFNQEDELEFIREVMENEQTVDKVILLFDE
jgi:polar amino acid transport system substrate-binding protein